MNSSIDYEKYVHAADLFDIFSIEPHPAIRLGYNLSLWHFLEIAAVKIRI
jgi:hypothetical protein